MKATIDYYDKIGKHGLQASESRLGTNDDFATAQKLVRPGETVLDLTCGYRVLKPDGYALLVLPDPSDEPWRTKHKQAINNIFTCYRTIPEQAEPLRNRSFAHTKETVKDVICQSGFENFTIECKPLNYGRRMVVNLFKGTAYNQQQIA